MLKVRGAAPGCCCCGRPLCSAAVPPAPASTHVPLPRCRCFWVAQEAATLARVAAKYETDLKKVQDALNAAMESGAVVCATPLPGLVRRRRGGPAFWDRTQGQPPHPETSYPLQKTRIPRVPRR